MYMKTQGHVTQCHSQFCDFQVGCDAGLATSVSPMLADEASISGPDTL